MKRIIYLLMIMLVVTACNNYEYDAPDPDLKIKESQLDFDAKGGNGYILMESNSSISAISNANWCQVKVVDKKIEVAVSPNSGIENRTAIVTATSEKGIPVNVPVTQLSASFIVGSPILNVEYLATTEKIYVTSGSSITVSSPDSWITPKYENDSISISVMTNNGASRSGTVVVTSNNISQTIKVIQAERTLMFKDLLGEWTMTFYTSTSATDANTRTLTFKASTTADYYDVTGLDYSPTMKVKFNNTSKTIEIYGGQGMGLDPGNSSLTLAMLMYGVNIATPSSASVSWSATFYYRGVWNKSFDNMVMTFGDSGTWSGYTISGMRVVSSTVIPVVSGSYTTKYSYYKVSMSKK